MSKRRVAIVAGGRTPFVKAGKTFKDLGPFNLASHAVRGLVEGHGLDPASIEAITYGVVVPEPGSSSHPSILSLLNLFLELVRHEHAVHFG